MHRSIEESNWLGYDNNGVVQATLCVQIGLFDSEILLNHLDAIDYFEHFLSNHVFSAQLSLTRNEFNSC